MDAQADKDSITVYLMRHAKPVSMPGGRRYIGRTDLALSPDGVQQAQLWRPVFQSIALKAIYCSDLQRSHETAKIVCGDVNIPVIPEARLAEIDLGEWDGQTFDQVRRQDPLGFERRGSDPADFRPPLGESFSDLSERVVPFFEKIAGNAGGNVLIVGHAGVNRVILCHILGLPLGNLFRFEQDYAAMNLIDATGGRLAVRTINLGPEWIDRSGPKRKV